MPPPENIYETLTLELMNLKMSSMSCGSAVSNNCDEFHYNTSMHAGDITDPQTHIGLQTDARTDNPVAQCLRYLLGGGA